MGHLGIERVPQVGTAILGGLCERWKFNIDQGVGPSETDESVSSRGSCRGFCKRIWYAVLNRIPVAEYTAGGRVCRIRRNNQIVSGWPYSIGAEPKGRVGAWLQRFCHPGAQNTFCRD